jgi:hypothetical protein
VVDALKHHSPKSIAQSTNSSVLGKIKNTFGLLSRNGTVSKDKFLEALDVYRFGGIRRDHLRTLPLVSSRGLMPKSFFREAAHGSRLGFSLRSCPKLENKYDE